MYYTNIGNLFYKRCDLSDKYLAVVGSCTSKLLSVIDFVFLTLYFNMIGPRKP